MAEQSIGGAADFGNWWTSSPKIVAKVDQALFSDPGSVEKAESCC